MSGRISDTCCISDESRRTSVSFSGTSHMPWRCTRQRGSGSYVKVAARRDSCGATAFSGGTATGADGEFLRTWAAIAPLSFRTFPGSPEPDGLEMADDGGSASIFHLIVRDSGGGVLSGGWCESSPSLVSVCWLSPCRPLLSSLGFSLYLSNWLLAGWHERRVVGGLWIRCPVRACAGKSRPCRKVSRTPSSGRAGSIAGGRETSSRRKCARARVRALDGHRFVVGEPPEETRRHRCGEKPSGRRGEPWLPRGLRPPPPF